jgi:hypothetical protein
VDGAERADPAETLTVRDVFVAVYIVTSQDKALRGPHERGDPVIRQPALEHQFRFSCV